MAGKARQRRIPMKTRKDLVNVIFKALDYTGDAILIGDLDGRIYYHNKAYLDIHAFGTEMSLEGKQIQDVERSELLPILDEGLSALKKTGAYRRQIGTVRRDGVYHDVSIAANLIPGFDPPVVVAIMREITDLVQTQKELERRNKDLNVLNTVTRVIMAAEDREEVIKRLMQILRAHIGADTMGLFKADYQSNCGILVDSIGIPPRIRKTITRIPLDHGAFGRILKSKKVFVIEEEMPGYRGGPSDIRAKVGAKKTIGLMFRSRGGNDYMLILGLNRDMAITPETRNFFGAVTDRFWVTIEKMELLDAIRSRQQELDRLTAQLISSAEDERRRCSRMLHDEIGQALVGLRLEIDMLERNLQPLRPCARKSLEALKSQIKFITGTTRTLSKSLHPAILEDLGLVASLNSFIDNGVRSDSLEVEFEDAGFDEEPPFPVSLALYRVAQECLTNVLRHSGASRVKIKLTKGYPHVIMVIEDNGRGMAPATGKSKTKGLGLINMRERIDHMGGTFQLVSSPGKGTRVRVTIPIEKSDAG
jgi:PAS domain S-box-containing protein